MKNIYLIGHMGAGKSTLAPLLAEHFNLSAKDTDAMVENMFNLEVSKIFENFGEPQFRIYETAAVLQTTLTENLVVATGGGVLKRPRNADFMKTYGTVIYLKISINEQKRRIEADQKNKRPLLDKVENLEEVLQELHDKRNFVYQYTADFTVDVDNKTPVEIFKEIANYINSIIY